VRRRSFGYYRMEQNDGNAPQDDKAKGAHR
jgi:hypothetical protein